MNTEFDYTKTYYKITNKEENHNGFQFKDGLNKDTIPFNAKECAAGGIYFSDIRNIFGYLLYNDNIGYYVREVTVPEGVEIFVERCKYKAHEIILSERKELSLDTIKELILKGADIHANRECALRWSSKNGYLEITKYLVEQGANVHSDYEIALLLSSQHGHLEVVKYLVEQGVNIRAEDGLALQWASTKGHLEVVQYLVEQGVNIHINNDVALQEASRYGHLQVVKYLVQQGGDIHGRDDYALRWASKNGHLEIVKYLESLK